MLQPKYHAVITIDKSEIIEHNIKVETGRPIDADTLKALKKLQEYHGITGSFKDAIRFSVSQTWDPEDVGREIEKILRENGLTEISIKIYAKMRSVSKETLLEV